MVLDFEKLVKQLETEDYFITGQSSGNNDEIDDVLSQHLLHAMRDIPLFL